CARDDYDEGPWFAYW
nr:immunoglobulin heavy chain junction region [Mus musculus]